MPNLALAFGAVLGGALVIDYGVKNVKSVFDNGTSTPASMPSTSDATSAGGITKSMLAAIGASKGWTGQEIDDWMNIIHAEDASGSLTAKNPTSPAYGIAQFIGGPSEYYKYGGNPYSTTGQLTADANYIQSRYGSPSVAWSFHLAHGWY